MSNHKATGNKTPVDKECALSARIYAIQEQIDEKSADIRKLRIELESIEKKLQDKYKSRRVIWKE